MSIQQHGFQHMTSAIQYSEHLQYAKWIAISSIDQVLVDIL